MKKYLLFVLITLFTPIFTYAAWWSPTTWFDKPVVVTAVSTSTPTTTIKYVDRVVEKPTEKIITKAVDNPALLKKIKGLEDENAQLNAMLDAKTYSATKLEEERMKYLKLYAAYLTAYNNVYKAYQEDLELFTAYQELIGMCKQALNSPSTYSPSVPRRITCSVIPDSISGGSTIQCN